MQITFVPMLISQDFGGIDQLILRKGAAIDNARAEEYPLCYLGAMQGHESFGKFIRRECSTAKISPGSERTVKAIALTY
jgi:hypothetical protein